MEVRASRGVNISIQWAEGNVSYGRTREAQLSSLRKKIYDRKNSKAHKEATSILETAQKDTLHNLNAQSEQSAFGSFARVFRTGYYVAKIANFLEILKS